MPTIKISLPDDMKDWVFAQNASGKYKSASVYIRELIHRDQERAAQTARLQALVDRSIASGVNDATIPDIMERVKRRLNV